MNTLTTDSQARKDIPLARGVLDYFPAALAAVAELSKKGNDKHNPGEDLHWARNKSGDHADCILRHLVDRGTIDASDGMSHTVKVAWRALALLQEELEAAGAPMARGARADEPTPLGLRDGWVCTGCGSREVYEHYDDEELLDKIANNAGPFCATTACFVEMVRA